MDVKAGLSEKNKEKELKHLKCGHGERFEAVPNMEADAFAADSNMSTDAAPPYPWSGTLAEVYQLGQLKSGFLKRSTPLLTMLLLVRDCLFVRVILLVSQLAFISEGRSPIRHLGTRPIGWELNPQCSAYRPDAISTKQNTVGSIPIPGRFYFCVYHYSSQFILSYFIPKVLEIVDNFSLLHVVYSPQQVGKLPARVVNDLPDLVAHLGDKGGIAIGHHTWH
ncbi:hypothetical protein LAZ67_23000461, partial [Cordylochernes scorpioides]